MRFTWDPRKAAANLAKHGVSFADAATAFGDPLSLTIDDPDHSVGEERFVLVGSTSSGRVVVIAHGVAGDEIRLISARVAGRRERKAYEET